MSKYTTNKYGIVIGYSSWFFFRDQYGDHREFPATMWLEGYNLDQINSANYFIQTPAQQFMFRQISRKWPDHHELFEHGDEAIAIPPKVTTHYVPTYTMRRWLDENAPGWATSPIMQHRWGEQQNLYFTRVGHARACRDFVAKMIAGTPTTYRKEK